MALLLRLVPQIAYCMIIYLAGLTAIEPEQIEAARLDGAKGWKLLKSDTPSALARYIHSRNYDRHTALI